MTHRRQPSHTVYGGAHLFRADTAPRLGARALRVLKEYAADADALATAVGIERSTVAAIDPVTVTLCWLEKV